MVRIFKLDLEGRISKTLKITCKVISWLIEYAVDLVNKVQVGQNGKNKFRTCPKGNGSVETFSDFPIRF